MLKWAVTGGHDSALIAGADHTLHLLSTLQKHCFWPTAYIIAFTVRVLGALENSGRVRGSCGLCFVDFLGVVWDSEVSKANI